MSEESTTISISSLPAGHKIRYSCGCENWINPQWMIQQSLTKCAFHTAEQNKLGLAHHIEMGAIKDGRVQSDHYVEELTEPLKEMGYILPRRKGANALEIGCGAGMYIRWLVSHGFNYLGIEPDIEIAEFTRSKFGKRGVGIDTRPFDEKFYVRTRYSIILACHVFEHMKDSPEMMRKAWGMLEKDGKLILIVPNDEDPVNPDHYVFLTPQTLRATLETVGFRDIKITVRQRVKHEKFLYCLASK